jgi:hypothetical protein
MVWYDQGLGRSIWFQSGGKIMNVRQMIDTFEPVRRAALWKGIGHAASFIGGCDSSILHELQQAAAENAKQLGIGAVMAARGRVLSNSLTPDTDLACRTWWKMSAGELTSFSEQLLPLSIDENIYDLWQKALEQKFVEKELIRQ